MQLRVDAMKGYSGGVERWKKLSGKAFEICESKQMNFHRVFFYGKVNFIQWPQRWFLFLCYAKVFRVIGGEIRGRRAKERRALWGNDVGSYSGFLLEGRFQVKLEQWDQVNVITKRCLKQIKEISRPLDFMNFIASNVELDSFKVLISWIIPNLIEPGIFIR